MGRAYLHGIALVERRTHVLAPSGPARIAIIWVVLALVPAGAMAGATHGVVALLCGFVLEFAVVGTALRMGAKEVAN